MVNETTEVGGGGTGLAEDCNSHLFHHSAKSMNSCPKAGRPGRARALLCALEKKAPECGRARIYSFVRSFVREYQRTEICPATRRLRVVFAP